VDPQFFTALVEHAGGVLEPFLSAAAGKVAGQVVAGAVSARLKRAASSGDRTRAEGEASRLRDTVDALAAEVRALEDTRIWERVTAQREASDPGFADFVDDAMAASAGTRDEAKRRLFGRLIAHRLQIATDAQEAALRRALRTTRDLSAPQLIALAAIALLNNLGKPEAPFASHERAEDWLNNRCGRVFGYLSPTPWTYDDLETLVSVGAVSGGVYNNPTTWADGNSATVFDQWLAQNGVPSRQVPADDVGSSAWQARVAAELPVITKISRLGAGRALDDNSPPDSRTQSLNRFDSIRPTPLGLMIGNMVLEQLCAADSPT
jgi:hypothetical protein